jgi:hypothetical protein
MLNTVDTVVMDHFGLDYSDYNKWMITLTKYTFWVVDCKTANGLCQIDHLNQLITLSVITWSGDHNSTVLVTYINNCKSGESKLNDWKFDTYSFSNKKLKSNFNIKLCFVVPIWEKLVCSKEVITKNLIFCWSSLSVQHC